MKKSNALSLKSEVIRARHPGARPVPRPQRMAAEEGLIELPSPSAAHGDHPRSKTRGVRRSVALDLRLQTLD